MQKKEFLSREIRKKIKKKDCPAITSSPIVEEY